MYSCLLVRILTLSHLLAPNSIYPNKVKVSWHLNIISKCFLNCMVLPPCWREGTKVAHHQFIVLLKLIGCFPPSWKNKHNKATTGRVGGEQLGRSLFLCFLIGQLNVKEVHSTECCIENHMTGYKNASEGLERGKTCWLCGTVLSQFKESIRIRDMDCFSYLIFIKLNCKIIWWYQ